MFPEEQVDEMAEVIIRTVKEFGEHPFIINCGLCYDFAEAIEKQVNHVTIWEIPYSCEWPCHAIIEFQGRFYDAEEPFGVDNWWQLPIFRRCSFLGRRPKLLLYRGSK